MRFYRRGVRAVVGAAGIALVIALASPALVAAGQPQAGLTQLAQAGGTERPELEPRYQPVPPEETGGYNSSYIFGLTRGVADSTIHPAVKAPLFFLTVPLDLAFLPFATIGGFFG
jgi:hypothetical protein